MQCAVYSVLCTVHGVQCPVLGMQGVLPYSRSLYLLFWVSPQAFSVLCVFHGIFRVQDIFGVVYDVVGKSMLIQFVVCSALITDNGGLWPNVLDYERQRGPTIMFFPYRTN